MTYALALSIIAVIIGAILVVRYLIADLLKDTADHDGFFEGGFECDLTGYVHRPDESSRDTAASKSVNNSGHDAP